MNELGGWKNIPIEDPKLEQAILFLKAELALKEPGFIYEDSLNAKSQVVSGIKFQIRAQGSCKLKTCYLDSFIWQKVDGEWELLEYKISESPIEDSE